MATSTRHVEISNRFLGQAEEEFEKGDVLQASEKAWGAIAHYVKSIAKVKDWPDGSHRNILCNAETLLELTSNPDDNKRRFSQVRDLHVNFYEEYMETNEVRSAIDDARALLDAMREAEPRLDSADGSAG